MIVTKADVRGADQYYGLFYARPDRVISAEYILRSDDRGEDVLCYDYVGRTWDRMDPESFRELLETGSRHGELSQMEEMNALWFLEMEQEADGSFLTTNTWEVIKGRIGKE